MKLRVLAVIAATLLMTEGAYAMDCCKGEAKCACFAPKEAETPTTPGAKPHH